MRLPEEVAQSSGYHVLEGVEELLLSLCRNGFLLGITTGAVEAAAHIKLAALVSTVSSPSAATARTRLTAAS